MKAVFLFFCLAVIFQVCAAAAADVVQPPVCTNNKGETVRFIEREGPAGGIAVGMAVRNRDGQPVVVRSNFATAPARFQQFIDRHECGHHQTGDIDRPHPPRNSPAHLLNEAISDCIAVLRLRDEEKYDTAALAEVSAALRHDMAKVGFVEITISSRISNMENCYRKEATAGEFIDSVLEERGLRP